MKINRHRVVTPDLVTNSRASLGVVNADRLVVQETREDREAWHRATWEGRPIQDPSGASQFVS
jgi:hypothetical protein